MIKFIYERPSDYVGVTAVSNIEIQCDAEANLDEVLDAFEDFLRAVGYSVEKETIMHITPDDLK